MNVRAGVVRRLSGRMRMTHDVARLLHDVGRLRRIRFGRLLNHAEPPVQDR